MKSDRQATNCNILYDIMHWSLYPTCVNPLNLNLMNVFEFVAS
jgi:hypothetical protein